MKKHLLGFTLVLLAVHLQSLYAQCPVKAVADKKTIFCGDSVKLSASGSGTKLLDAGFNNGVMGSWASSKDCRVTDGTGVDACSAPAPEGNGYLWFPTGQNTPRHLTSNGVNLSGSSVNGATISFFMRYGIQGNAAPCEGIDLPDEGVHLEYSTNGTTWTQIQYWSPNGGYDANLTNWKKYTVAIPANAFSSNTQFRWMQNVSSGISFDSWGIDKIEVIANDNKYRYDWTHDGRPASISPFTPAVAPVQNATYTVKYSNKATGGNDSCSASVVVQVNRTDISASASQSCVENGRPVTLYATNNSAPVLTLNTCDLVHDTGCVKTADFSVGNASIVNPFNSGTGNVFGDFGDAYTVSQMLFRADELKAAGMKAGELKSISFTVNNIEDFSSISKNSATFENLQIKLACTTIDSFAVNTLAQANFGTVLSVASYVISKGINTIHFNKNYYWDGVSNVIVGICWFIDAGLPGFDVEGYAKTVDSKTTFRSFIESSSNFSNGMCTENSFVLSFKQRPNISFGMCVPMIATSYSWTSIPAGFTSNAQQPQVSPTVNTTYIVSAVAGDARCTDSDTVEVCVYGTSPTVGISNKPKINFLNLTKVAFTESALDYSVSAVVQTDAQVQLSDITGRVVAAQNVKFARGENPLTLSAPVLSNGIYFLRIVDSRKEVLSRKLVRNIN